MIDLPFDQLDNSPTMRRLLNQVIKAAQIEYQNDASLMGAALREMVNTLRSPSHEIWKEMKISPSERMQYNNVANAAHQTLKGKSNV